MRKNQLPLYCLRKLCPSKQTGNQHLSPCNNLWNYILSRLMFKYSFVLNPKHTEWGGDLPPQFNLIIHLEHFFSLHMIKLYVNSYFVLMKTLTIWFGQKIIKGACSRYLCRLGGKLQKQKLYFFSVCLSIYLSVNLSICLSVYLSSQMTKNIHIINK